MSHRTDQQLLHEYADGRSEEAFAELVRRHIDFVFSAALRMVRDTHLAQDVAQGVFLALASNARRLTAHSVLAGWLHCTARNIAAQTVRSDVRRRTREQEAAAMNELLSIAPDSLWEQIAPQLDTALNDLNEADRDALLLRYFQGKSAREIGQTLGISDEAAQKRISRAVERLRDFFARRGVAVGSSGLAVLICANAIQAAPVGLSAAITATVLTATTLAGSATMTVTALTMTALQKAALTTTIVVAVATGIYEAHQVSSLRHEVRSLQQQQAPLGMQIQNLQQERDEATNRLATLAMENARLALNSTELPRLRSEIARLKASTAAAQATTPFPSGANTTADAEGLELGEAIVRGDRQAFEKLLALAREEQAGFRTNSLGLNDQQREELARRTFLPLRAAFSVITREAVNTNPGAVNALSQMLQMPEFQGLAIQSLGTLAGKGNKDALEVLLDPPKFGVPSSSLSSLVGALVPAAGNGDEKAIGALAAVAKDPNQRALWFFAADGLNKAAEAGNP